MSRAIPTAIRKALDETGLTWTIESGKSHLKIRLDGHFCAILPYGGKAKRCPGPTAEKNSIAQIKRRAREIMEQENRR